MDSVTVPANTSGYVPAPINSYACILHRLFWCLEDLLRERQQWSLKDEFLLGKGKLHEELSASAN